MNGEQVINIVVMAFLSLSTGLLVYIVSELIKFHAKFIRMEMHVKGLRRDVIALRRDMKPGKRIPDISRTVSEQRETEEITRW